MKSSINLEIELDANRVPERIQWSAPDGGVEQSDTQAIMLSVWDDQAEELLRIDLWTKEMSVDHMKRCTTKSCLPLPTDWSGRPMNRRPHRTFADSLATSANALS